jgi:DNA-binding GntR family transcriptional regulator
VKQPSLTEVHELYDVRLALELFVVAHLAEQGMDQALWQLLYDAWAALLADEADTELDGVRLAHQDVAFHEALAEATGNRQLYEHLRLIDERLYFTRMTDITTVERLHITCRHHLHILECIRQGAPDAAQAAIRANIEFGRGNVEDALKEALARAHWRIAEEEVQQDSLLRTIK